MAEKYHNWLHYSVGYLYRIVIRGLIRGLVQWKKGNTEEGCTAIMGMCSRLPHVLPANLRCLREAAWPGLKRVLIVVDSLPNPSLNQFIDQTSAAFKDLNVEFVYYSPLQFRVAEFLKLPYVFCWLSWCIAIAKTTTRHFFIHDYDALLLGDVLNSRYKEFMQSGRKMQGVVWYTANGFVSEDCMVSTFEAFVDTSWVKKRSPIKLFNQIGLLNNRRVDFDILLHMQARYANLNERAIIPMTEEELVHPCQMVHQYIVFNKFPSRPWNCAAITMIPFFYYLSGQVEIFKSINQRMANFSLTNINFLNDGCLINFSTLRLDHLERMLRLMVQGFVSLGIEPFADFFDYGDVFYKWLKTPDERRWKFTTTNAQREWINCLARTRT
jgi:hypothetical protein